MIKTHQKGLLNYDYLYEAPPTHNNRSGKLFRLNGGEVELVKGIEPTTHLKTPMDK